VPTPVDRTVKLRYTDVALLAMRAGWRGNDAITAVAIAQAESRFDPGAHNFTGRDLSYGLWQINMKGDLGPTRRARYRIARNEDLYNPEINARVAYAIWLDRGKRFTDWSTYNNGAYIPYKGFAQFAVSQVESGQRFYEPLLGNIQDPDSVWDQLTPDVANPLSGIDEVGRAVSNIGSFVTNKENWFRVAATVGGGILIMLAVLILLADTIVGQVVRKAMKTARVTR